MNRLRRNLVLAFVLSVVLPVAIVQWLTFNEARKQNRAAFVGYISAEIRQIDSTFSYFFGRIEDNIQYFSELPAVKAARDLPTNLNSDTTYLPVPEKHSLSSQALYNLFERFGQTHQGVAYIYMGNEEAGYLQWPAGELPPFYDPRPRPWYQTGKQAGGKITRTGVYYWAQDDVSLIGTVRQVTNQQGEPIGVIGMDVTLDDLTGLVKNINYGKSGYLMLVEETGNILVDAENPGNNFKQLAAVQDGEFAALSNAVDGSYDITVGGEAFLATIYQSPTLGWRFIGLIPKSEAEAVSDQLLRQTVTIILISLAVFVAAAIAFSTRISNAISIRQKRLEDARAAAEQASKAKTNFLSTISHEIRTPLNGILGMAQLVADTDLSNEQEEKITTILASGKTLLAIINDVLDMSKIEADALSLEETPFSFQTLLSGTMTPFAVLAEEKGIKLVVNGMPEGVDWVIGDPVRLRQVLWNLISNAIKFTQEGQVQVSGSIDTKRTERDEQGRTWVSLRVEDTGVGIDERRLASIFEPFAQEDSSTTRKYGGTGLGLAIVSRLVNLMDGKIIALSQVGKGSSFEVRIPFVSTTEPKAKVQEQAKAQDTEAERLNVLVAEDNPVNATIAKSFLTKAGCDVLLVGNGRLALEACQERLPDLIFMDVHMPEMDGVEATKQIRQLEGAEDLQIIGLTADAFEEHHRNFVAAGMSAVMTKPFAQGDMIRYVEACRAQRSL